MANSNGLVRIESNLPPEDCRERIEAALDGPLRPVAALGAQQLLGRIDGYSVRLTYAGWRRMDYGTIGSYSGQPTFVGKITPTPSGSALVGVIPRPFKWWKRGLWSTCLFAGPISVVFATLNVLKDPSAIVAPLSVAMFAGIGWFNFRSLDQLHRRDVAEMLGRLSEAIEG